MNKSSEGKGIKIKPVGIWKVYPDKNANAIQPRWWHKLMFWKRWNYSEWKIRKEYKKLSDIINDIAGN